MTRTLNPKDPKQVARWVAQELAKHRTPAERAARLAAERRTVALAAEYGLDGTEAHLALIAALTEA